MTWALDFDAGAWDPVVRIVPFLLGVFLLLSAALSIVRTLVIPRMSISWIFAVVIRSTDAVFWLVARLLRGFNARDRLLAWSGPIGIMVALVVWLALFLCGYTLLIFGISDASLGQSALQAGSGLLTLGIVGNPRDDVTVVDFIAAMTGPAVIALLIGFLPTLYTSYLARESRVLLEAGISGAPPWGPEFLARVQLLEGDKDLSDIFGEWIPWVAQVRLTQTLYPSLSRFRSSVSTRNWLIALLSVLDAATLRIALRDEPPNPRTVALLQQGAQAILTIDAAEIGIDSAIRLRPWERRIQNTFSVFGVSARDSAEPPEKDKLRLFLPDGMEAVAEAVTLDALRGRLAPTKDLLLKYEARESTITREEFGQALDYLRLAGVTIQRSDDEAFDIFRHVRGRYESAAYHLAQRFYLTPAPWSGPRHPAVPVVWPALAAKLQQP